MKKREIRVFISSTFRDMQEEREELVKKVFPVLAKFCRQRGVELVAVDLRWGITKEQSEKGKALPVCLSEIEKCKRSRHGKFQNSPDHRRKNSRAQ
ncbi:DUF4062 domain-containing protein [candidate division KSB1 bacterium]|nr:DUF4062 domain-containing protein [candidate division KSB1 bacterium]